VEAAGAEEGLAILHQQRCHMLVLDDERHTSTRRKSLELLRQAAPSTPIVLRTVCRCHQAEADAAQVGAEAVLPRGELPLLRQMVLRLAHRSGPRGIVRE
jgi:DNA-binding NarL/FixJ family response regulator